MANNMSTLPGVILVLLTIIVSILRWLRRTRPTANSIAAFSPPQRIQALASDLELRVKKTQDDFSGLERRHYLQETEALQICDKFARHGYCSAPLHRLIRNRRRRRRISSLCAGYKIDALDTSRMSGAFVSLCERLLAMNRIWGQEKQIKKLESDGRSAETSRQADSFHAFCNKLLLHNKVWQLEGQVGNMGLEVTMLKRKLAATTKGAARKMTEVKHERLIQSHIKTLEVGSWNLGREVEKLNLVRQASFVEQNLQNEFEDSLYGSLRAAQRRIEDLEARLEGYQHTLVDAPAGDEDETFTISSLTCVSSDSHGVNSPARKGLACLSRIPMIPRNVHSARWFDHSKRQRLAWPKRLILGNYTGFSFNPLFYGPNVSPQALTSHQRSCDKRKDVVGTAIPEARRQAAHAHVRGSIAQWSA